MAKDKKNEGNMEQLNSELTKKVEIKVVSSKGHDEYTESPQEALRRIKDETTNNGKWAYLDGKQVNPINLNVADILEAEDITLTNALVGG